MIIAGCLNNSKQGVKENLFRSYENGSKRDIASEIDYSDQRSIATSVTLSNRYAKKKPSDTHSMLSKDNLDKLDNKNRLIRKGGGGSIYSDAMSQRSKLSKYSKRGNSLDHKRINSNALENIPEVDEVQVPENLNN